MVNPLVLNMSSTCHGKVSVLNASVNVILCLIGFYHLDILAPWLIKAEPTKMASSCDLFQEDDTLFSVLPLQSQQACLMLVFVFIFSFL